MSYFDLQSLSSERRARQLLRRYGIEKKDLPFGKAKVFPPVSNGNQYSSYDYLNLRMHPIVLQAASDALTQHGMSATSSRVLSGELECHFNLEKKLSALYSQDSALLFVSGHTTNTSTVSSLVEPGDIIFMDQYAHNSLQIGASLSGSKSVRFRHNDIEDLSAKLKEHRAKYRRCLIITEGHFSMDGDIPDLGALCGLRDTYDGLLMVDEAHSLGVLGKTGRGVYEEQGIDPSRIDIWMGTLSKSLGSTGGFITANNDVIEHLRYFAPGFAFSVGINAPSCAAAESALDLIPTYTDRIQKLRLNSLYLWKLLFDYGYNLGSSKGFPIIPIILPLSVAISSALRLLNAGWSIYPLVPPSVLPTQSRLRLFVRADHETHDLDRLFKALQQFIY